MQEPVFINVFPGIGGIYRMFQIKGWSSGPELNFGQVFFVFVLKMGGKPCSFSNTKNQQTGCQRIQRTGMANFDFFYLPATLQPKPYLPYYICRCPAKRLVHT
jgi:hypothetical protein